MPNICFVSSGGKVDADHCVMPVDALTASGMVQHLRTRDDCTRFELQRRRGLVEDEEWSGHLKITHVRTHRSITSLQLDFLYGKAHCCGALRRSIKKSLPAHGGGYQQHATVSDKLARTRSRQFSSRDSSAVSGRCTSDIFQSGPQCGFSPQKST